MSHEQHRRAADKESYLLNPVTIVNTADNLKKEIAARLPGSALAKLAEELDNLARQSEDRIESFKRPVYKMRIFSFLTIFLAIAILTWSITSIPASWRFETVAELFEAIDTGFNLIVLLAGALWFLYSLEATLKRKQALESIKSLRQFIHTIDITQLYYTPDIYKPDSHLSDSAVKLDNSYLLLCAQMLGIIGNLSALYAQADSSDSVWRASSEAEILANAIATKLVTKTEVISSVMFPNEVARPTSS